MSALNLNQSLVLNQGFDGRCIHIDAQHLTILNLNRDLLATHQSHSILAAQSGGDHTLVDHLWRHQCHITLDIVDGDAAFVDHLACAPATVGLGVAARHVGVGVNAHGRCHHAAHIDFCVFTKHNAVGIHEDDLAVRVDSAIDHGLRCSIHNVECRRIGIGLIEVDGGIFANIE